jgi:multidrug transporter EmrE-like cation transporter
MNAQAPTSRLKIISYAALFTSIAFGITGQLLMKFTMSNKVEGFLTGPWLFQLIFALTVYSFGVANWVVALRYVKLSIAYPLTSLNYVGILLGSYYFFNEKITSTRIIGVVLIFVGVLLVAIPLKQFRKESER